MGFFSWLSGTDKYGAAQDALIAKHTFAQLTDEAKRQVVITACKLLESGGYPVDRIEYTMTNLREGERYCMYAMAMASMGIEPSLKGILYQDQWYPISNPFVALLNADKQLKAAQYEIRKKSNIDISLSA